MARQRHHMGPMYDLCRGPAQIAPTFHPVACRHRGALGLWSLTHAVAFLCYGDPHVRAVYTSILLHRQGIIRGVCVVRRCGLLFSSVCELTNKEASPW